MPELPEVETVKNILKLDIVGKKILDVKVNYDKISRNVCPVKDVMNSSLSTFFNILS